MTKGNVFSIVSKSPSMITTAYEGLVLRLDGQDDIGRLKYTNAFIDQVKQMSTPFKLKVIEKLTQLGEKQIIQRLSKQYISTALGGSFLSYAIYALIESLDDNEIGQLNPTIITTLFKQEHYRPFYAFLFAKLQTSQAANLADTIFDDLPDTLRVITVNPNGIITALIRAKHKHAASLEQRFVNGLNELIVQCYKFSRRDGIQLTKAIITYMYNNYYDAITHSYTLLDYLRRIYITAEGGLTLTSPIVNIATYMKASINTIITDAGYNSACEMVVSELAKYDHGVSDTVFTFAAQLLADTYGSYVDDALHAIKQTARNQEFIPLSRKKILKFLCLLINNKEKLNIPMNKNEIKEEMMDLVRQHDINIDI